MNNTATGSNTSVFELIKVSNPVVLSRLNNVRLLVSRLATTIKFSSLSKLKSRGCSPSVLMFWIFVTV